MLVCFFALESVEEMTREITLLVTVEYLLFDRHDTSRLNFFDSRAVRTDEGGVKSGVLTIFVLVNGFNDFSKV